MSWCQSLLWSRTLAPIGHDQAYPISWAMAEPDNHNTVYCYQRQQHYSGQYWNDSQIDYTMLMLPHQFGKWNKYHGGGPGDFISIVVCLEQANDTTRMYLLTLSQITSSSVCFSEGMLCPGQRCGSMLFLLEDGSIWWQWSHRER